MHEALLHQNHILNGAFWLAGQATARLIVEKTIPVHQTELACFAVLFHVDRLPSYSRQIMPSLLLIAP